MQMQKYKCDICGKTKEVGDWNRPDGWCDLSISTKDEKGLWKDSKEFCVDCFLASGVGHAMKKLEEIYKLNHLEVK